MDKAQRRELVQQAIRAGREERGLTVTELSARPRRSAVGAAGSEPGGVARVRRLSPGGRPGTPGEVLTCERQKSVLTFDKNRRLAGSTTFARLTCHPRLS